MSEYESNVTALRAIARATDAIVDEFAFFEGVGPESDRAIAASHRWARLEHRNPVLRRLGDERGGVDHHSTLAARGSMAQLALEAMCRMLNAPGNTTEHLVGSGEGEDAVVRQMEFIVSEVASDGLDALDAGLHLEGKLSDMVRGQKVEHRTFLRNPNDWIMEFAQDVAKTIDHHVRYFFEGEGDEGEVTEVVYHNVDTRVFTPKVIRDAVVCCVMGEGMGQVTKSWGDFDSAWHPIPLDDLEHFPESDMASLVVAATEKCGELLEAARWCAAYCTAFAALHKCLSPYECP